MNSKAILQVAKGAGILFGVYAGFKIIGAATDAAKAGGDVVAAVKDAAVKTVTETLNPASDKNIVYTSANKVGGFVSGDSDFNLGASVYNFDSKIADAGGAWGWFKSWFTGTPAPAKTPSTVSGQVPASTQSSESQYARAPGQALKSDLTFAQIVGAPPADPMGNFGGSPYDWDSVKMDQTIGIQ